MLDALKGLTGGRSQKQVEEFQTLIAAAREERSALNTMLTQITMRSSRLSQIGKTLGEVDDKTAATSGRLVEVDKRVAGLEDRAAPSPRSMRASRSCSTPPGRRRTRPKS